MEMWTWVMGSCSDADVVTYVLTSRHDYVRNVPSQMKADCDQRSSGN